MEKTKKYYLKAMDCYCEGKIDKALDYCDKCLNISRDYSPALNLKGMIYYIKGDLHQAQTTWRVNYKVNGDEISKKYLEDSRKDEELIKVYTNAVNDYKEIKIHQALEKFLQCEQSHFNILNLNNYLSKCYLKIGQYDKCDFYIDEVLKIDKTNEIALETKRYLIQMGLKKRTLSLKSISLMLIIPLILIFSLFIFFYKDKLTKEVFEKLPKITFKKDNKQAKNQSSIDLNKVIDEDNNKNTINDNTTLEQTQENQSNGSNSNVVNFNFEEVRNDLEKKQYEKLITYLGLYNKDKLSLNEKALLLKVEEEVNNNGVKYFYDKGMEYIKNKDYKNSLSNFNKIYLYSKKSYLNQHILYMIGYSYENLYDTENANKYYEIYVEEYKSGDYIEQCVYNLAILNENVDKEKAKKYANKLVEEYPNSQFNNTRIRKIINN